MYTWERFNVFQKGIRSRFSLFAKINLLIIILFIPILIMYTYSNNVTYDVVSKELQVSNTKQLTFLSSQIDSRINQMMDFSLILSRDPNVRAFNGLNLWQDKYDQMQTRYIIQEKMTLQTGVTDLWPTRYAVYSQQNKEVIANYTRDTGYDEAYLKKYERTMDLRGSFHRFERRHAILLLVLYGFISTTRYAHRQQFGH